MARIEGTDGDDYLEGGAEGDVILGRRGYDWLVGNGGNDHLDGGARDDLLDGGFGRDLLEGGAGGDALYGGEGNDTLAGDRGDDFLRGDGGDDVLEGGSGNDALRGGTGIDQFDGGLGEDTLSFFESDAIVGVIADLRTGEITNDGFNNRETFTSMENFGAGTIFADVFYGNEISNSISVGAGDSAYGFEGDDTFAVSSVEGSTIDGGIGIDTIALLGYRYELDSSGIYKLVFADEGVDINLATHLVNNDGFGHSQSFTQIENATGARNNDRLVGNADANTLYGDDGDDYVFGGSGDDIVGGGLGNDTLKGGRGADIFSFGGFGEYLTNSGSGYLDEILDFSDGDKIAIISGFPIRFIGNDQFSGRAGEVRYEVTDGDTFVTAYWALPTTGESYISIKLEGIYTLTADDFISSYSSTLDMQPDIPFPV